VQFGETPIPIADFTWLRKDANFIAMIPQWDFLNFLVERGKVYPGFRIEMNARVTGLIEERGGVAGAIAETPSGPLEVHAPLPVGADGRTSDVRALAKLEVEDVGAPIDVFWMRVSRLPADPGSGGRLDAGRFLAMIARGDYWQLAVVIPKGAAETVKAKGLAAFRDSLLRAAPFLGGRVNELQSWDDIKLLTVRIDRLKRWRKPGVLCIGDAAHAMSPVGGVGINLAVQDAVAAANILANPLLEGVLDESHLAAVQARREFPARVTQRLQVVLQNRIIRPVLASTAPLRPPWFFRLFKPLPLLRRIPARIAGVGVRPEHVAPHIRNAKPRPAAR
jgi:2-polyprenyl-6-methoxyphenol hydroxylase-like FAD-dependent oxidoreductase